MEPEFSRVVNLDDLSGSRAVFPIEADETERAALAGRFGLESIGALTAEVSLKRVGRTDVEFTADIAASVVQTCVASLEPFPADLAFTASLVFRAEAQADEAVVVVSPDEDVEPLPEGGLDIGEVVAVELALALDPFPRSEGVESAEDALDAAESLDKTSESPFGALARRLGKE